MRLGSASDDFIGQNTFLVKVCFNFVKILIWNFKKIGSGGGRVHTSIRHASSYDQYTVVTGIQTVRWYGTAQGIQVIRHRPVRLKLIRNLPQSSCDCPFNLSFAAAGSDDWNQKKPGLCVHQAGTPGDFLHLKMRLILVNFLIFLLLIYVRFWTIFYPSLKDSTG